MRKGKNIVLCAAAAALAGALALAGCGRHICQPDSAAFRNEKS